MTNPKISIITASYNYENYIKETIESVLAQDYANWEMIIVDDGSKDNSIEVIKEYCKKDSRIKLYQHENAQNKGLAQTIQLGIQKANGDWITFLESDDTITSNYLSEKIIVAKNNPDVNLIFNNINFFGNEEIVEKYIKGYCPFQDKMLAKIGVKNNLLKLLKNKKKCNPIPTFSCVMLKPNLLEDISFESPYKPILDWYIWLQIAQNATYYYIKEKLTNWRMHGDSYINSKTNEEELLAFICKRELLLFGEKIGSLSAFGYQINAKRQRILRIHFKEKEIIFLGKKFKF